MKPPSEFPSSHFQLYSIFNPPEYTDNLDYLWIGRIGRQTQTDTDRR